MGNTIVRFSNKNAVVSKRIVNKNRKGKLNIN